MKTEHWVFMGTMVGVVGALVLLGKRKGELPRLGNPQYWDSNNPILKNKSAWKKKHLNVGKKAKYARKTVTLDTPVRLPKGGKKKFLVYHQEENGKVHKIEWGDPNLTVKNDDPGRASNFWARHGCEGQYKSGKKNRKLDPTTAGFWACYGPSLFAKELVLSSDKPW